MSMPCVARHLAIWVGCIGVAGSCTVGDGGDDQVENGPSVIGTSAGGQTNIISDGWVETPVRFGNNVKMLNFRQLKAEVARATGVTSYDWGNKSAVFGAADYKATFQDDRTPGASKIVAFRKIAFEVCDKMMTAEATTPKVFSTLSPKAALTGDDPKVAAQVKLVFGHVFLEEPTQEEVDLSLKALTEQTAAGASAAEAWAGLCTGYLSSMRFLSCGVSLVPANVRADDACSRDGR